MNANDVSKIMRTLRELEERADFLLMKNKELINSNKPLAWFETDDFHSLEKIRAEQSGLKEIMKMLYPHQVNKNSCEANKDRGFHPLDVATWF